MSKVLPAGTVAPGFTLRVTPDQNLSLSDLAGRPVVLAFNPVDWSPVCGEQMALHNEVLPEFHKHDAEVLGISVDSAWCHEAFAKDRRLHFPLLADFHPKGAVAKQYGAYREGDGVCERARRDLLELLLANRRKSRRRRHPGRAGKDVETGDFQWARYEFQSRSMTISRDR